MKKYSITLVLIILIMFPGRVYPQGSMTGYENLPWCFWCIALPVAMVYQIFHDIDESRTVSVDINGAKGTFRRNSVVFTEKGKGEILSGELLKEVRTFIKGEEVNLLPGEMKFHENGKISYCRFTGAVFHTGDGRKVQSFNYAELYDDETLKRTLLTPDKGFYYDDYFIPADDEKPAGIDLVLQGKRRDVFGPVSFYPDGSVKQCMTAIRDTYSVGKEKVSMPRGTLLDFTEEGTVTAIEPPDEKNITLSYKGKSLSFSGKVVFYESGLIKSCTLKESLSTRNGDYSIRIHGPVDFYDNGIIKSCSLTNATPLNVNGNTIYFSRSEPDLEDYDRIEFHRNGKVKTGTTDESRRQIYRHKGNSFSLKDDWKIEFFESGAVRKLCIAEVMDITVNGMDIVLDDANIRFYRDGKFLSFQVEKGTEFTYKGNSILMDCYVGIVFLNKEQEIIAFINDGDRVMNVNGEKITVPDCYIVGYDDYSSLKVSFVQIDLANITFPENVRVKYDYEAGPMEIFVKADRFYNRKVDDKTKLLAKDIRELMFAEDTVLIIDGREVFCPGMEWIKVR